MADHAPLAPSAAHRWARCPGSVRMTKDIESKANRAAARGTAMHQVLEVCLKRQQHPSIFLDYVFDIDGEEVTFSEELVGWTTQTLEWVQKYKKEHKKSTLISEAKLHTGAALAPDLVEHIWGTADVLVYSKDELLVLDLKGGYVDVPIEDNYQLILYAIGAVAHFEDAMYCERISTIRLVIHQPQRGGAKELVVTRETLDEWKEFLEKAAREATKVKAPLRPSDEACKWCPALGQCPAAAEHATQLARIEPWPEVAKTITEEQLVAILRRAALIRKFLDAAEEYATGQLVSGYKIPGFKLVASKKHRKWKDEEEAAKYLEKHLGPGCWKRTLVTPAQAEKLTKDKAALAPLVEIPEGEPTLAPESDGRPTLPFRNLRVVEGPDDAA